MDPIKWLAASTANRLDTGDKWKLVLLVVMIAVTMYCSRSSGSAGRCKAAEDLGTKDPDAMSPLEMVKYFYWYDTRWPCRITNDFGGVLNNFPKMINGMDGHKKMCMDPGLAPRANSCVVYDFGVGNEWSFDEAVSKLGCQIYAFDPSMETIDYDRTPSIHFRKIGISDADADKEPISGWKLMTLESIYEMLRPFHGDVPIDYVKMDIELYEWKVVPQIVSSGILDKVKQLAVQLHLHTGAIIEPYVRSCIRTLRALEESGMVRFGSRVNYYMVGPIMGRYRHTIYELVFYNKKFV